MKRALYEWGTIFFVTITVICACYRFVSVITDKADVSMILDNDACVLLGDGGVMWTNRLDAPTIIEEYDQGQFIMPSPPKDVHFALPGVTYRKFTWPGNRTWGTTWDAWVLRVSLVLPAVASALLASFCIWRYRRLRLSAAGRTASEGVSSGGPGRA
jgi:hypothetical protein